METAELAFLRDLAVVLAVSAATTVLFHLLRQPAVLGYIVAGVIIGPHTPPFSYVSDLHSIHTLAELGIVLLLFSLGLEFDLRKLRRVGGVAFIGAILEILLMVWLGYSAGRLLGWGQTDSLFLGALLSISSTTIIVQVLLETGQLREPFAQIILGILIVEDIAAIVILALLSGFATAGAITFADLGWALLKVGAFMSAALVLGILLLPRLLAFVAAFGRSEMLTVTVLGLAFGLAVLGGQLGFSVALGAFLMGAIMAESDQAERILERVAPIREMFTAVFFVATGMLFDPKILWDLWGAVLLITAITVVGKIASVSFATFLAGYPGGVAVSAGLGMAQVGEFSFIIARLGQSAGVTGGALYPIAVAVSSLTCLLTPYLLRSARAITALLERLSPRPLVTFSTFYGAWLSRLASRATESRVQPLLLRLALYLAATVGLFVATWSGVRLFLPQLALFSSREAAMLPWALAALAALPFLFLIGRTLEALTQSVAATLFGRRGDTGGAGLVRSSLGFLFGWVAAIFVLAVGSPVLPPLVPLAAVVLGLLVATFLFWESLARFHGRIEEVLSGLANPGAVEAPSLPGAQWEAREEVMRLLSDHYGPEVQTEDFIVPLHPTGLNQPLSSLGLRTLTGASIIAIYRDPDRVLVPRIEEVILPGDVLLLLGEREQLEAALRYLGELARRERAVPASPPRAAAATVAEGSPLCGRTVGEAGLREQLGVLVVGIRRAEERITNPGADFRVRAGDVLYLWGPAEQVEEACKLAGSP